MINDSFFNTRLICYLTIAGSHAYGTNTENSDLDTRGFFLEDIDDLFSNKSYKEEFIDQKTDTVVYSFKKFITLLTNCNPNIIELLNTPEILYINEIGQLVKDNYQLFLSKKAYMTFIGYATNQLKLLKNNLLPNVDKKKLLENTLLKNDLTDYGQFTNHIENEEIITNINIQNIPLKLLVSKLNNFSTTIKNFNKLNHRNRKKDKQHLFKHAMHLIRLLLTGIDILEKGEINTYRKEKDLLLSIRNGQMSLEDIFQLNDELTIKIKQAYDNSSLPNNPDYEKINQLMIKVFKDFYIRKDNF